MTIRERNEKIERQVLSCFAAFSENSHRAKEEDKCDIRMAFQQDRDRIIHSKAFRRLKRKAQMFIAPKGDHFRTRLTHTLEVSQIARTIARALRLNEDLTEAIALGHDLGHTPFGHAGEGALDKICPEGFRHYEQSLRVVGKLEKGGAGLNLTDEVRDGILNHTNGEAVTLEGQVVKWADAIAFLNHDISDAVRAGILEERDIPTDIVNILGNSKSLRINKLVYSLVENSEGSKLAMADNIVLAFEKLHDFMFEDVYLKIDAQVDRGKIPEFIKQLYVHFKNSPESLPADMLKIVEEEGIDRAVCDYIAGMTDPFAMEIFKEIFEPSPWGFRC